MFMQLRKGIPLNESDIAHTVFPKNGGADIIINNEDPIDHPYHLRMFRD